MSQNKTVFPGVGSEGYQHPNQNNGYQGAQQPYSRSTPPHKGKGTIYPGMEIPSNGDPRNVHSDQYNNSLSYGKPIIGFLYSISRTGAGEFWPLHIGQNSIGNSPECDIVLGEGTVTSRHANIHINKMKKPEKIEATLSDLGSTNGTCINGNSVSVARPVECLNGDIITIGENYELLILLIDTKTIGLSVSENFIDVRTDEDEFYTDQHHTTKRDDSTRENNDFPPRFDPNSSVHSPNWSHMDATVGTDSNSGFKKGGTVPGTV